MSTTTEQSIYTLKIAYVSYLVSAFIPLASLVGLIISYKERDRVTEEWMASHYDNLIYMFWFYFVAAIVCFVTMIIVIGVILFIILWFWFLIRAINCMLLLNSGERIINPKAIKTG